MKPGLSIVLSLLFLGLVAGLIRWSYLHTETASHGVCNPTQKAMLSTPENIRMPVEIEYHKLIEDFSCKTSGNYKRIRNQTPGLKPAGGNVH